MVEITLAGETAFGGELTVLIALNGEPTPALAGGSIVQFVLIGEPTLALAPRYADNVRTRDLFSVQEQNNKRPLLIETMIVEVFAEAGHCLALNRQAEDS